MTDYEDRMKSYRFSKGDSFLKKLGKTMMSMADASNQGKVEAAARRRIDEEEAYNRLKTTNKD